MYSFQPDKTRIKRESKASVEPEMISSVSTGDR